MENCLLFIDNIIHEIDSEGHLLAMPVIIDGYRPDFLKIFKFFDYLKSVTWTDEKTCLKGVAMALSRFYSFVNFEKTSEEEVKRILEFKIFDLLKSSVYQPSSENISSQPTTVLATLPQLYKIFERC